MAKKVGLHKMVGNEASIFGRAASSFEELATDLAQRIRFESRHETPFVLLARKLPPGRNRESEAGRPALSKSAGSTGLPQDREQHREGNEFGRASAYFTKGELATSSLRTILAHSSARIVTGSSVLHYSNG